VQIIKRYRCVAPPWAPLESPSGSSRPECLCTAVLEADPRSCREEERLPARQTHAAELTDLRANHPAGRADSRRTKSAFAPARLRNALVGKDFSVVDMSLNNVLSKTLNSKSGNEEDIRGRLRQRQQFR